MKIVLILFLFVIFIQNKQNLKSILKEENKNIDFKGPKVQFNCPPIRPSNPEPTDARKLLFSDIKAFMSLGDSITAA
jgi:hypothetical protein